MKRYPFAALAAAMGMSEHAAADALDVRGSTEVEYRRRGVTERVADRLAVAAGFHPSVVWPDWMDDVVQAEHVKCADAHCDVRFIPRRKGHVFCSKTCGNREAGRIRAARLRATNPEYRERQRVKAQEYRDRYPDYIKAERKRWREANQDRRRIYMREWSRRRRESAA